MFARINTYTECTGGATSNQTILTTLDSIDSIPIAIAQNF